MSNPVNLCKFGLLAMVALCVAPVWAAEPTPEQSRQILENLKQARPDLDFSEVSGSPIDGLYAVNVAGGPTLYVTGDGKYFVAGDLFGVESGHLVNIQEQQREKDRLALLQELDRSKEIVFSPKGEAKAVVHVFTDVDCGYCQKLHREMDQYHAEGIEIRYLAYPRSGPDSETGKRLATAWCAKDQQQTLTKLKNREPVSIKVCDQHPVAEHYALGGQMGVNGTPNIITESGQMIGGYVPAKELAEMLQIQE